MPRVPSQKLNHGSTAAPHPYAINNNSETSQSVPSSSVSGAHSPRSQQHRLNNSQHHMSALRPPRPSRDAQHEFDTEQLQYREDDSGSRLKQQQMSPIGTPHAQTQPLNGKSMMNHGSNHMSLGQDVMVKAVRNGTSLSTESSRAPQNGNAQSSAPPVASTSGSSSAPASNTGSSMGVSGGPAPKKKHVCPTCDRAFTTSGHLARHARVHTGERNHKCPFPGCETRCSRQDNLQQHYRIHLSPGSRRSSSSATRAAIQRACAKPVTAATATTNPPDLDSPPPLAQATFPAVHLSQSHVQYAVIHQPYPPTSTLSQTHVPASHISQHPYHPQTPPVSNGQAYENSNSISNGVSADASQGYSRGHPDSPAEHSGPASTTPSADASPVIGGNASVPPASHPYPAQHQTYIYVQHPGYYTHAHPSHGSQASTASAAVYSTPPPSSGLDGQYPSQPQISTFYQQHHYPREAYISSTQGSTTPLAQSSSYVTEVSDNQNIHDQTYTEPPKVKMKRRGRSSDASIANDEQSPNDSPVITNTQGQTNNRSTGQGQSNVYAYYGMAAPPSAGSATAPSSSAPSHSNTRYSVNGNGSGFGQFQLHTPPPPPPLTSSSTVTTASSVSYASTPGSYSSQNIETNSSAANGNGTHSPPPVLAPIQQKRPSYPEALPSRYSYAQHTSPSGYASIGKDYPE